MPSKRSINSAVIFGLLSSLFLACGGCATSLLLGGRVTSSPAWDQQDGRKKIFLIVSIPSRNEYIRARADEINQVAAGAIRSLPRTELVGGPDSHGSPAPCPSDAEAVAVAKSRGADAVCVVAVQDYSYKWGIGAYPPGWFASDYCLYSLRLIDVQSGELLNYCVSSCEGGGWGIPRGPADLKKDLNDHLVRDLTPPRSEASPMSDGTFKPGSASLVSD